MPQLDEILEKAGHCQVMTKLDLSKGYYQVTMDPASRALPAFVCQFGKFEFVRMPFGLKNAPAVFQRLMETVLKECYEFAAPYLDDILIFSPNWQDHLVHVRKVLSVLQEHGLTAKPSKCEWGMSQVLYLGHVVGVCGTLAVPSMRVTKMQQFQRPVTRRQMRSFLGTVGYYRQFIRDFSLYSSLLSPATSKAAPDRVVWTEEMDEAFQTLRYVLRDVCVLHVPVLNDIFVLETDASLSGVGAALYVDRDNTLLPVAFYSRQLRGAEKNYSATELEALAILSAVKHFIHFLWGRPFTIVTDHHALVSFQSYEVLNRRLHGWRLKLADLDLASSMAERAVSLVRPRLWKRT